ncbi:MAG: hypothetical protein AB7N91_32855 [Candidatus Tectimicrobiota bacterium]
MKTAFSEVILSEKSYQYQGFSSKNSASQNESFRCYRRLPGRRWGVRKTRTTWPLAGHGARQPSRAVERGPRATTAQQRSKSLILLKKQADHLSKSLILRAHESGTFCIDCTGTPGQADKRTRHNRTSTVDFQDEATYFRLLGDGKAFAEWVITFLLSLGFQLTRKATCSGGRGLTRHSHYARVRLGG